MSMLKNYWYVACASSQLAQQPRAVTVMDESIVLFRDAAKMPRALDDRCCHRGVQLSIGKVVDGNIACTYHGWRYDGSGRCVHVPSLCEGTPIPDGFRVRHYPCVEQDHYVWVWLGGPEPTTAAPLAIEGAHDYAWKQGVVAAQCRAEFLIENILDSSHVPFVHKGTHPAYFFNRISGFKEYDYEVRLTDAGLVVFYPPTSSSEDPFPENVASFLRFELPDRVYVFQRGQQTDFYLVLHMVRCGPSSSRIEWIMRNREGGRGVEWVGSENTTLHQDRAILESAQKNYDRAGSDFERSVPADYALLMSRKLLDLARDGNWESGRAALTQRKLVHVRQ
jgi:nitrite reductase/ring-hydroxylating ferredoxin subunit